MPKLELKLSEAHAMTSESLAEKFKQAGFPMEKNLEDSLPLKHQILAAHKTGIAVSKLQDLKVSTNYLTHTVTFEIADGKSKKENA